MKTAKMLSVFLLLLVIGFTGCQKNEPPSVTGPNQAESLDKWGGHNLSAVYTISNAESGNEVLVFKRSIFGFLRSAGSYSTGGTGNGAAGLGSQGAIILKGNYLYTVNAGSDEISVMKITPAGLSLVDKVSSNGSTPISLTVHNNLLYVLNSIDENISGYKIANDGTLTPIAGSTKPLSGTSVGAAQIEFSPNGKYLVVTEKATNIIDTYIVGSDGIASNPISNPSAGVTPFGFEFDNRGHIIVSEAFGGNPNEGAMSSYNVGMTGTSLITGPVPNNQTAPCWVVITNTGWYSYTSNAGTSNISGYRIRFDGSLSLLNDGGNTAGTGNGSHPIDMALSDNSLYLYALSAGTNTISVFLVGNLGGRLYPIQTISGLPATSQGLAAN